MNNVLVIDLPKEVGLFDRFQEAAFNAPSILQGLPRFQE